MSIFFLKHQNIDQIFLMFYFDIIRNKVYKIARECKQNYFIGISYLKYYYQKIQIKIIIIKDKLNSSPQ